MFKNSRALFILAATTAFTSSAFAADAEKLSCTGSGKDRPEITLKARMLAIGDKEKDASLWDVVMTYQEDGSGEVKTGRAKNLDADPAYKPRKYKNHVRFDMSRLTDTQDFGQYLPGFECFVSLLLPKNAATRRSFEAPVIYNCDQNGGSMTLDCTTEARRD